MRTPSLLPSSSGGAPIEYVSEPESVRHWLDSFSEGNRALILVGFGALSLCLMWTLQLAVPQFMESLLRTRWLWIGYVVFVSTAPAVGIYGLFALIQPPAHPMDPQQRMAAYFEEYRLRGLWMRRIGALMLSLCHSAIYFLA